MCLGCSQSTARQQFGMPGASSSSVSAAMSFLNARSVIVVLLITTACMAWQHLLLLAICWMQSRGKHSVVKMVQPADRPAPVHVAESSVGN